MGLSTDLENGKKKNRDPEFFRTRHKNKKLCHLTPKMMCKFQANFMLSKLKLSVANVRGKKV